MIKILCFYILFLVACNSKEATYVAYNMADFKERDVYGIKIIDYRLPDKSDFQDKNYASLYICYDYEQKKTVKVVSHCQNAAFEKNALAILIDCRKLLPNKNIIVASDGIFEEKYKGLPTFYANVVIPTCNVSAPPFFIKDLFTGIYKKIKKLTRKKTKVKKAKFLIE